MPSDRGDRLTEKDPYPVLPQYDRVPFNGTKTKRNREMNHFQIDNFRAVVPLRLPGLIEEDGLETIDDYGDYALLTYLLQKPVDIQTVMNRMEDDMDLTILYHVKTAIGQDAPQHCCAYSSPSYEAMYKFNAQTSGDGMVRTLYVYIFESLEVMLEFLKDELKQHAKAVEFQGLPLSRLVADFM